MIASFLQNASGIIAIIEILGFVVMGLFVFTGIFGSKNNERRTEADRIASELIERLKEKVEQLEQDMTEHTQQRDIELKDMTERLEAHQKEIHQLQGSNDAYLKILTLRDPAAQKVFSEAPAIFEIAKENNQLSRNNGESIIKLTNTLNQFIENLRPILIHLEPKKMLAKAV